MTTREKILYESLKSFLTIGIDQTSLNNIADAVSIKKPSIYYHFKSKEEIIQLCVYNTLDDLEHRIEQAMTQTETPKEQLEALYECVIEFHKDLSLMVYENHLQLVNLNAFLQRAATESEDNRKRVESYYHKLQNRLILLLSAGQKQGLIKNALNKEIVSIDLIARIEGMINLSTLYSAANINTQRGSLYESVWEGLKSEAMPKKKKLLDYKSIDLGRKW